MLDMRKTIYAFAVLSGLFAVSCNKFLDIDPRNKVSEEIIVSSEAAIDAYAANLYGRLPVEDFNWSPYEGFKQGSGWGNHLSGDYCDESMHSQFDDIGLEAADLWSDAYSLIRDINLFIEKNPEFAVSEEKKQQYLGEGYMMRAMCYGELAKRYGGVPVIKEAQEYLGDGYVENLRVDRSTEFDTWKFVVEECGKAAGLLDWGTDTRRFNRWSALAYKTRYALYAASIAKFTQANGVYYEGEAVDKELVGIDPSQADYFYGQVLSAGKELIDSKLFGLFRPDPASPDEAAENYQMLFESPDDCISSPQEPIFCRGYKTATYLTHNFDIFARPVQLAYGWKYPGRTNPTLDLVDDYDDYNDDGLSNSGVKVLTTVDGLGDADVNGFDPSKNYLKFDDPTEIFANKDARLKATVILPGSIYKDTKIIIQGGIVKSDGSYIFRSAVGDEGITGKDGKAYYTFGAADQMKYSGFDAGGSGSYTRSGFLIRKWMQENRTIPAETGYGDNTWIDMRYAEVLLNYAEAAVEMTNPDAVHIENGEKAINAIRKRAGHTDELHFSGNENNDRAIVRNERRVELAFENKRYWDLFRWRTFHTSFVGRKKLSLVPFIDLREENPKYIFVRMTMPEFTGQTFFYTSYYRQIPGTGNSGLIQNPA